MDNNFKEFFGEEPENKIDFSKLNKQQLEAVNTTEGPVLIIAGAGSGKTSVITYRLAKLINSGVNPENILLLTFTNKAAHEMIERAQKMLDSRVNKVSASTYHSFCVKILKEHYFLADLNSDFTILTSTSCSDVINIIKTRLGLDKDRELPNSKTIIGIFSFCANRGITIEEALEMKYSKYENTAKRIEKIKESFEEYKLDNNMIDYDDMLLLVNKIFKENPGICKKYSERYKYIMVDEYQDSNILQMEFLRLLRQWDNKNICVVGDDMQCIYSFRGANFRNIIKFPKAFPGTKVIKLIKNYRSNQEILDLANAIINNAPEKYEKQLIGLRTKGEKPKLIYVNDPKEEAQYIFYKIWRYYMEGVPLKEMAVLIRNSQDSNQLELIIQEQMSKHPVPFQKFGGLKFLEKEICLDILAFLSILISPRSEIFWFRIFKLYQNIGNSYSEKLTKGIKDKGLEELLDKKHIGKKYGKYLTEIYDEYKKMSRMKDVEHLLDYLINNYYYKVKQRSINESKVGSKSKKVTKADLLNKLDSDIVEVRTLIEMSKGYESVNDFLEAIALDSTASEDSADKLTISTVHSAKGLEFSVVFVMDCVDSVYPGERPLENFSKAAMEAHNEELEEARRLLYVAVTRAKDDLFIMFPNIYTKFGKFEKSQLSRFIEEDNIFEYYCDGETV